MTVALSSTLHLQVAEPLGTIMESRNEFAPCFKSGACSMSTVGAGYVVALSLAALRTTAPGFAASEARTAQPDV